MATDIVTIDRFIAENGIALKATRVDRNPSMPDSAQMDHWKVVLIGRKLGNARMTLHFSKGYGHGGAEPEAKEVLGCLADDSATIENCREDFTDFCSELGYNADSREAERIFKATLHQSQRLERFLGADEYNRLLWHTERD